MTTDTDTLREALERSREQFFAIADSYGNGADAAHMMHMACKGGGQAERALATLSKPEPAAVGEPVAVIGANWRLHWASPDNLSAIVGRTGIEIGSKLYASPVPSGGADCPECDGTGYRQASIAHKGGECPACDATGDAPSLSSEAISPPDAEEVPIMLCVHCGRDENSAKESGHNFCLAPFDQREHVFTKAHPYLKMYREQPKGTVACARPCPPDARAVVEALTQVVALAELHIAERSTTPEEEVNYLECAYLINARALIEQESQNSISRLTALQSTGASI